jgi:6-methylsalicylic acid synthase
LDGNEQVAIVGMGFRLPRDVRSAESFWSMLLDSHDSVGKIPTERWAGYAERGPRYAAAVRRAVRSGHFLERVDGFDPQFFGISPREAELMDPQQRILLEVAWEALEDAGITPTELAGSDTGVFVGACTHDYGGQMLEDLPAIDAYSGIGAAGCAVANRISHSFDLRGPSLAVDTACSASLVALHLACQSVVLGESSTALVGGVNLILTPGQSLTLDAAGALAPDGRTKAFDSLADGYGRGEGCGVLVLKRRADAERDGDGILALVSGSAVRQEGRTEGIMAPSAQAQEDVLRKALERSGPADQPCLIGSVKSNIGHLEGAAGVASIIKTVLALRHGLIPPNVMTDKVNPAIDWDGLGLRVPTAAEAWPTGPSKSPRRAGVSGFGYGGTIAHVLLEEAPATGPDRRDDADRRGATMFPLSARSEVALRERAAGLADRLAGTTEAELPLADVAATLARRRSHLTHRAVVLADSRDELVARLRSLARSETTTGVATGTCTEAVDRVVWVFSGHGSHWAGMGADLLASEPAFAETIAALEPAFVEELGLSARQALVTDDLSQVDTAQASIFAMQVGLAATWRRYGLVPDAVIGHSVGEVAAAVVAGALSLEDGARLICRRSRLLRRIAGQGAMAMVGLPFDTAARRLVGHTDLAAAISASPSSTVVSGTATAVAEAIAAWEAEGLAVRRVASDVAFHSPQVDPLLADLTAAAWGLEHLTPEVLLYSTALDDPRGPAAGGAGYWAANLRNPVRLYEAVSAAVADGYRAFLEVSPHPVVTHSIRETLYESGYDEWFVGSTMRRHQPAATALLESLAEAHCHGVTVPWEQLTSTGGPVPLPPYPWQDRRYWREVTAHDGGAGQGHRLERHSLLGEPVVIAGTGLRVWSTELDDSTRPYPGSHALRGAEIVPAAVIALTFLDALGGRDSTLLLADLEMRHPLLTARRQRGQVVSDGAGVRLATCDAGSPMDGDRNVWLVLATAREAGPALAAPRRDAGHAPGSGTRRTPNGARPAHRRRRSGDRVRLDRARTRHVNRRTACSRDGAARRGRGRDLGVRAGRRTVPGPRRLPRPAGAAHGRANRRARDRR